MQNNYTVFIDSTRISVPLDECKIIDNNLVELISKYTVNTTTGEQLEETFKVGSPHVRDNKNTDGTYYKIFLERSQFVYVNGEKVNKPYLTILLNSKQGKKGYFKGINKDNYKDFYDLVMQENVFSCSYDTFKNARYNDTDIAFDFKSTLNEFEALKTNIKRSSINPSYWHSLSKKDNSGIWAPTKVDPRKQGTPAKPYVKFYSKQIDMETNSYNFAQAYLKPYEYNNVYRCEVTVKNVAHKKRLGLDKVKTIWSFLNLDLKSVMISITNEYFVEHKLIKAIGLTPSNYIMINLMNQIIKLGGTRADILKAFDVSQNGCSNKSKSNAIAQYHKIMQAGDIDKEKLNLNETSKNVFGFLGIDKK